MKTLRLTFLALLLAVAPAFGQGTNLVYPAPGATSNGGAPATATGTLGDVTAGGTNGTLSGFSYEGALNVKAPPFGAKGNGAWCRKDAAMSSGSAILTCSTTHPFTSAMVGGTAVVYGAGSSGTDLITTVLSYTSSSSVTLAASNASGGAVSSAVAVVGTDDSTAFSSWLGTANYIAPIDGTNFGAGANSTQGNYYVPPGTYIINTSPGSFITSHDHIRCDNATIVFTGAGPFVTWGDGGTHYTIDHIVDGCQFYGTSALNTEWFDGNYSDKDRYYGNKFYATVNGTAWLWNGNGDGGFLAIGNLMNTINRGFDCEHRCDDSVLIGNVFGYLDRAVIMNGSGTETDASFSLLGNKCNVSTSTTAACFDIGSMEGGEIKGNYYESDPSGGGATECGIRVGYLLRSGFNLSGVAIEGNVFSGHGADAALCSLSNGVSNGTVNGIAFKHNTVLNFAHVVDNQLGLWYQNDVGPNYDATISSTLYVGTGLGNGNWQELETNDTAGDNQTNTPIIDFKGLRFDPNGRVATSANHNVATYESWIEGTGGASGIAVNLEAMSGEGALHCVEKEDSGAGAVTVNPHAGYTIEGASSLVLSNQWDWVCLFARSTTTWHQVAGNVFQGHIELPNAAANAIVLNGAEVAGVATGGLLEAQGTGTAPIWLADGSANNALLANGAGSAPSYGKITQSYLAQYTTRANYVFSFGTGTAPPTTTTTQYGMPFAVTGGGTTTSENQAQIPAGAAGKVLNLQCSCTSAAGASNSYSWVFRVAGATPSNSPTCTISGASATTSSDTTDSATFTAGQLLDWQFVTTVGGSGVSGNRCTLGYEGDI